MKRTLGGSLREQDMKAYVRQEEDRARAKDPLFDMPEHIRRNPSLKREWLAAQRAAAQPSGETTAPPAAE